MVSDRHRARAARRLPHLALASGVAAVALLAGACSGDDDDEGGGNGGPLTTRELHRAVEAICADEIDLRTEDGNADQDQSFIQLASDGDVEGATEAAAYNIEAADRMSEAIGRLEATDEAD